MEYNDVLNVWKSYDQKLNESLVLNRQNTEDITRLKVQSFLSSMKPIKIFTVIAGILWVGFLDMLVINLFHIASPFFLVSAGLVALLNTLAIGIYLYQLILIHESDLGEPIIATQKRIARLKSSTLWVARLLFLQLPAWTTFYLTTKMLQQAGTWLLAIQILVTWLFLFIAVWLFFNIKYSNRNKKWFRLIFSGREWGPVMKSKELLEQIAEV